MGKNKPLTAEEQALLEQGWQELGESIAGAVVSGKGMRWAWDLIGPLGLYKHWMLEMWVERYAEEHPEPQKPLRQQRSQGTKPKRQSKTKSKFTKREQIHEALRLLKQQMGR